MEDYEKNAVWFLGTVTVVLLSYIFYTLTI
jgi:hypothetical protein